MLITAIPEIAVAGGSMAPILTERVMSFMTRGGEITFNGGTASIPLERSMDWIPQVPDLVQSLVATAGTLFLWKTAVDLMDDIRIIEESNEETNENEEEGEAVADNDYYKEGLKEIPDDWVEVEEPEEYKVKSEAFKEFLRKQGKSPKRWKKVVEKWDDKNGDIYQRHYWTNGSEYYYHGVGIEIFIPH